MTTEEKKNLIPIISKATKMNVVAIYKNGNILKVDNDGKEEYHLGYIRIYNKKVIWIAISDDNSEPYIYNTLQEARKYS